MLFVPSKQWKKDGYMRSVRKTVPVDALCDIYIKHEEK